MSDPICTRCGNEIHVGEAIEFDAPVDPEQRIIVDGPTFHHAECPKEPKLNAPV